MIESKQNRHTKRMRLAARIIGLGAAGLFLVALIAGAIAENEPFNIEAMLLLIIVSLALAGGILSWWRDSKRTV